MIDQKSGDVTENTPSTVTVILSTCSLNFFLQRFRCLMAALSMWPVVLEADDFAQGGISRTPILLNSKWAIRLPDIQLPDAGQISCVFPVSLPFFHLSPKSYRLYITLHQMYILDGHNLEFN